MPRFHPGELRGVAHARILVGFVDTATTIRLDLFGAPTVLHRGQSIALASERRTQLALYLALSRGWVGRAELAALLWPDQESKLAFTNLRKALHRLQALPWAEAIEVGDTALRFVVPTDVAAFERAIAERRLPDALAQYRGALLTGFDDPTNDAWTGWLGFERDRLRVAWRTAVEQHVGGDVEAVEAIALTARLLDADPLDDGALRLHMTALARAGQAAGARRAYREFAARLSDELGLEPGAPLQALHDAMSGEDAKAAPQPAPKPVATDSGFVGRTVELRRIAALLAQQDCRLLCVTGPGGAGKTRLARRAMQEVAPAFADGASFVSLEDASAATQIAERMSRELGIALDSRADPLAQMIDALRARRMLVVLDNFEQLTDGAALLETLLDACPGVKLLVTSRVRLALASEWLLPLEGLPCPDIDDLDRLDAFDAARLFVRAAQHVDPAFVATAEAAAIAEICARVAGLPLAIELAAAWTRVLSCDAIAAELRKGTELLHTTDPAQPSRHASMQVVFDHSWRLLREVEQSALARLSVFAGTFTVEAARAVSGAALPVLAALTDKSLLHKEGARLHLHPVVQQLAAMRLAESPAAAAAHTAHAAYFHRLLARLASAASSGDRDALDHVELELDNCRRAWTWTSEHGPSALLVQSSEALMHYCDFRGRAEEGRKLFRQAIAARDAAADAPVRLLLLSRSAHLEYRLDRYAEASTHAGIVMANAHRDHDHAAWVQALNVLGTCAFRVGRWEDARLFFKQRMEAATAEEQVHSLAVTLDHLALIEKRLGDYAEALRLSQESLALHRRLGDSAGVALCLNNLGSLLLETSDVEAAGLRLREGLAICERDGLVGTRGLIMTNLADVSMMCGDLDAAESWALQAIEVGTAIGNKSIAPTMRTLLATIALRRGDPATARAALAEALSIAVDLRSPPMMIEALIQFAELLKAQREPAAARSVLALAGAHPASTHGLRDRVRTLQQTLPVPAETRGADTPPLDFDEVVHRVVSEAGTAHAQLIAALRGPA